MAASSSSSAKRKWWADEEKPDQNFGTLILENPEKWFVGIFQRSRRAGKRISVEKAQTLLRRVTSLPIAFAPLAQLAILPAESPWMGRLKLLQPQTIG